MRLGRVRGAWFLALAVALVLVLALECCQLLLPGLAEQRIRDRLRGVAAGVAVSVHAFPAVELLWGDADRVTVRMASLRAASSRMSADLTASSGVGSLDVHVGVLHSGLLTLHDATLAKRGDALAASAVVLTGDLQAALPILRSVSAAPSPGGGLVVSGSVDVLGAAVSGSALVSVVDGAIQVAPQIPFGGLATLKVWSDPHVTVGALGASAVSGGFALRASGTLH